MKRHELLLEAVRLVRERVPAVHLEIVGSGPRARELRTLASGLGLDDAVTFTGGLPRAQVARRLREADLYVHTSATETFGVSIVEALFSGLPVVVSRAGGVTERIPLSMGRMVDEATPESFARALTEAVLARASYDRARIASDARALFGPDAVAGVLESAYREVVSGRSG